MRERIMLLLMILVLNSCSDETITNSPEAPYVPQITNKWEDEADSTHFFLLSSNDDDSLSSGFFTGNENLFDGTFDQTYQLTGAYFNRDLFIEVDYVDSIGRYNGRFIADNRIQLISKWKTIVISHSQ